MKAVVYERYGGPEVLELRELPSPRAGRGACRVRVAAASVNPADWKLLKGNWRQFTGRRAPRKPMQIGLDFAGTVAETGPGVRSWREGDAVMGLVNPLAGGSMAEYVVVPASTLRRPPANLELEEAAGVPVSCAAAWAGLHHRRPALSGRRVLITGAAGGVGHFALQIGVLEGARVTAVCSSGKVGLCRELGAAEVVDYTRAETMPFADRFDVIFDCASSIPWATARELLGGGGEYLLLDTNGRIGPFFRGLATQFRPGPRLWTYLVTPGGRAGRCLADLFERGGLRVVVGGRYPLERAADAYRESVGGHATGKILVTIGG